jgi:hypothetical protein
MSHKQCIGWLRVIVFAALLTGFTKTHVVQAVEAETATAATSGIQGLTPTGEVTANADEAAVDTLMGGATGELVGTGFTYRHNWGNRNGQWKMNLFWGAVRRGSQVFVAIGECALRAAVNSLVRRVTHCTMLLQPMAR